MNVPACGPPRARPPCPRAEGGFTTPAFLLATGLTLVVFVWVANLAVFLYGRGAVRSALDEAVRAGSRVDADSVAQCEARAGQALAGVLGGTMGRDVVVGCAEEGDLVRARAEVRFEGWLPPVPDWRFALTATVIKERTG